MEREEIVKIIQEIELSSQEAISEIALTIVNVITIGTDRSKTIALDFVKELYDESIDDINYQIPKRLFSVIKSLLEKEDIVPKFLEMFSSESILKDVDQFEESINGCDKYSEEYILYDKFKWAYLDKIKISTTKFRNLIYNELDAAGYKYVDQVREEIEYFEKVVVKKIYPLLSNITSYSQKIDRDILSISDYMSQGLKKFNTPDVNILPKIQNNHKFK